MTTVAFQGAHGAYSEQALRRYFGAGVETLPCQNFADVFAAVENKTAEYGILPVENSIAGPVDQSYDLLYEHDVNIYAEVIQPVRHTLLAPPGATLKTIHTVRSHPQALAQCQQYIARRGFTPLPDYDTAGSACDLAAHPQEGVAAIASALAGELYGLQILDRDIQDHPANDTRFFILSLKKPPRAQRNKTSVGFGAPPYAGSLYECLGEFARRYINLSKIESRPRPNQPWQYTIYIDFEGHSQDPLCEAALVGLLRKASFVKILGSYPAATMPDLDEDEEEEKEKTQEARPL